MNCDDGQRRRQRHCGFAGAIGRGFGGTTGNEQNVAFHQSYIWRFSIENLLQIDRNFLDSIRRLSQDLGFTQSSSAGAAASQSEGLQYTEIVVLNHEAAWPCYVSHHINDSGSRNNNRVSRRNINIVLVVLSQIRRQLQLNLLIAPSMFYGYIAPGLVGQSSSCRDDVEETAITRCRVRTRVVDLTHQGDRLRGRFIDENRDMRAADKSAILQPFLNHFLRLIGCQVRKMNVINEWKVNVP